MSAIAGVISLDGAPLDEVVARMRSALAPFGRDGIAVWQGGRASLARALVRIVPEDAFDRQPVHDSDSLSVVADARIDNRDELQSALNIPSGEAARMADADFVLRAFATWGEACLPRLLGDFAFAAWDARRARLVLARDAMANRPLFYCHRPGRWFAFASATRVLLALPGVPREVDEVAVADWMACLPPTQSFYRGLEEVPQGATIVLADGRVDVRKWHTFDPDRRVSFPRDDDYVDAVRTELDRAVRARLRSAGGIGAHLSSGLDSGSVVAMAAPLLAAEGRRLTAFTAVPVPGFCDPPRHGWHYDEFPGARAVAARHPNIDHVPIDSGGRSPLTDLEGMARGNDSPVTHLSNLVWLRRIEDEAKARGIGVLLTGSAGNFTVSWDGRFLLSGLLRGGDLGEWLRQAWLVRSQRSLVGALRSSLGPLLKRRPSLTTDIFGCAHPDLVRRAGLMERARDSPLGRSFRDAAHCRIASLSNARIASMMLWREAELGVAQRDPTGDVRLVELCLAIPEEQYLHRGRNRALIKRVMGTRLPGEVLAPKSRGLQAPDYHVGLRGALPEVREYLDRFDRSPLASRCLDVPRLRAAGGSLPRSGWQRDETLTTYEWLLLRGIGAGAFLLHAESEMNG